MHILVVGAGLTGCTLARLMVDIGHQVVIKERQDHIGGLCYTTMSPNGIRYEPYGGHIFHTNNSRVKDFVLRFSDFNSYQHTKGIILNGIVRHFPLSKETILELENSKQILKELEGIPKNPDLTNFETYSISKFGNTLYKLFMYNYSKKMWGIEPRELTTAYIKNRIELTDENRNIFVDNFQGLPIKGYTEFLKNMIESIPIELNSSEFDENLYDLILFSGRIDELMKFKYGALEYRSLKFEYKENDDWENNKYGTINLPQHPKFIRKVNFKVIHQQKIKKKWIQYQEPLASDDHYPPLYPIYTKRNIKLSDKYLKEVCKSDKIIPIGRLGLYKYIEMGQAVVLAMEMIPLIESWKNMTAHNRYLEIKKKLNN